MERLSPRASVGILLAVATTFATNHLAARISFDHGTSVAMAVATRAAGTALVLLMLLRLLHVPFAYPRRQLGRSLVVGLFVTAQSYCLYSAVASIPVALALLVFQLSPMLFMLLCWITGKEKPRPAAFVPMLVALAGLALALDLVTARLEARWQEIGMGVAWALAAAVSFGLVLYCNAYWVHQVDGRLRAMVMTAVTACLVFTAGGVANTLSLPDDGIGWLGLALLTLCYGAATTVLFITLPRLGNSGTTAALNFEPIALLGLAWVILGQAVSALQIVGAVMVVGALVWTSTFRK
jgi:drug/metabolite transporter (DMT)-like permease